MNPKFVSLAVVVASLVGYHLSQRSMPSTLRPWALFAFVYAIGMAIMLAAFAVSGAEGGIADLLSPAKHWQPWLLAASVTGIELGVYWMYKSGWSISSASTTTQAITAAVLVVIGLILFKEELTLGKGAGLALCVVGASLVAH